LAPLSPKGQTYSWAQSRLFDVHLIKEITSFLLQEEKPKRPARTQEQLQNAISLIAQRHTASSLIAQAMA
jgi:hypothetical protein